MTPNSKQKPLYHVEFINSCKAAGIELSHIDEQLISRKFNVEVVKDAKAMGMEEPYTYEKLWGNAMLQNKLISNFSVFEKYSDQFVEDSNSEKQEEPNKAEEGSGVVTSDADVPPAVVEGSNNQTKGDDAPPKAEDVMQAPAGDETINDNVAEEPAAAAEDLPGGNNTAGTDNENKNVGEDNNNSSSGRKAGKPKSEGKPKEPVVDSILGKYLSPVKQSSFTKSDEEKESIKKRKKEITTTINHLETYRDYEQRNFMFEAPSWCMIQGICDSFKLEDDSMYRGYDLSKSNNVISLAMSLLVKELQSEGKDGCIEYIERRLNKHEKERAKYDEQIRALKEEKDSL